VEMSFLLSAWSNLCHYSEVEMISNSFLTKGQRRNRAEVIRDLHHVRPTQTKMQLPFASENGTSAQRERERERVYNTSKI